MFKINFKFKLIVFCLTTQLYVLQAQQYVQFGNKLIGSGGIGGSGQGHEVSISADGKTVLTGGVGDNNYKGAAWVFTFDGTNYTQVGSKLVGNDAVDGYYGACQGSSVSISADGKTVLIGGNEDNYGIGAAWVFTFNGTNYVQLGSKLVGSGWENNPSQGWSVSLSADGKTALVGAYNDNYGIGAAWVFTFNGVNFVQAGNKLVGTGAIGTASQGCYVNLSGDGKTAFVSGRGDNDTVGATWVFSFNGSSFNQFGNKLVGAGYASTILGQGESLSSSYNGKTLLIGGNSDDNGTGATWVFTFNGNSFVQLGDKIVGSGAIGKAEQGVSVSLSANGKIALIGGFGDNNYRGAAWTFTFNGSNFEQAGNKLIGSGASGLSYQSIDASLSRDGNTVLIGGSEDYNSGYKSGAVWIFRNIAGLPYINVVSATISGGNGIINRGETLQMTASYSPDDANDDIYVQWNVFPTSVASISGNGLLTPIANGTVTVTGSFGDVSAIKIVTVTGYINVFSSTIAGATLITSLGSNFQMQASYEPSNANTNTLVGWNVAPTSIAGISSNGLLTPLGNGIVTVTGSFGAVEAIRIVTINSNINVASATISGISFITSLGVDFQMQASYEPVYANTNTLVGWSVSSISIASISGNGLLTPLSNGILTIAGNFGTVTGMKVIIISVNGCSLLAPSISISNGNLLTTSIIGAIYTWYLEANSIAGVNSPIYDTSVPGIYRANYIVGSCISPLSFPFNYSGLSKDSTLQDISEFFVQPQIEFQVNPNPNDGKFAIISLIETDFKILDITGKVIFEGRLFKGKNRIESKFLKGIYIIQIANKTVKLVIE